MGRVGGPLRRLGRLNRSRFGPAFIVGKRANNSSTRVTRIILNEMADSSLQQGRQFRALLSFGLPRKRRRVVHQELAINLPPSRTVRINCPDQVFLGHAVYLLILYGHGLNITRVILPHHRFLICAIKI